VNGACNFYFYGAGSSATAVKAVAATPITYTTPYILSGGDYAFLLSSAAPKFPGGYAIAVCNFLDGAGYGAILDNANGLGNWQLYANYLAQVLNSGNHF
jgi:hypothetical protein